MQQTSTPSYKKHKGYDIDLHYSPDEGGYYCSIWNEDGVVDSYDPPTEVKGTPKDAVIHARDWIDHVS